MPTISQAARRRDGRTGVSHRVTTNHAAALVGHGIAAAIFLLYTVAWLVSVARATAPSLAGAPLALWHIGQWLAVAAPAAWFVVTLWLTPVRPSRRRAAWLIVGILVLIPWQFIVGGS